MVDTFCRMLDFNLVNIQQIEEAVRRHVPFTLTTAAGEVFKIPHPDYVSLPPEDHPRRTFVMVYNQEDYVSFLPLITITSLSYKEETAS